MPYNLLLLPLLGGYLLVTRSHIFAFRAAKHSGERLIFMAALAAVVLLLLARVAAIALIAVWPLAAAWWHALMPWEYSGTAAFSLILGFVAPFGINCWRTRDEASARSVREHGTALDRLFFSATQGQHQISISLASGKVYAGWLDWTPPNPGAADAYIRILPTMSGHRNASHRVEWTTFYQEVYLSLAVSDEPDIEAFTKVIPIAQIVTAGLFDPEAYIRFNAQRDLLETKGGTRVGAVEAE